LGHGRVIRSPYKVLDIFEVEIIRNLDVSEYWMIMLQQVVRIGDSLSENVCPELMLLRIYESECSRRLVDNVMLCRVSLHIRERFTKCHDLPDSFKRLLLPWFSEQTLDRSHLFLVGFAAIFAILLLEKPPSSSR